MSDTLTLATLNSESVSPYFDITQVLVLGARSAGTTGTVLIEYTLDGTNYAQLPAHAVQTLAGVAASSLTSFAAKTAYQITVPEGGKVRARVSSAGDAGTVAADWRSVGLRDPAAADTHLALPFSQRTMANSVPVVIASDQTVPVAAAVGAANGTLDVTSTSSAVTLTLSGQESVTVQLGTHGGSGGAFGIEGSVDGTNFFTVECVDIASGRVSSTQTVASGKAVAAHVAGFTKVRARITSAGTATIPCYIGATAGGPRFMYALPLLPAGTPGSLNPYKSEDAAHSSGEVGDFVLGVRNDALDSAKGAGTNGDYSAIATDLYGRLLQCPMGGKTNVITPTVSNGVAYSAGDQLGGVQTLTDAIFAGRAYSTGQQNILATVAIVDKDKNNAPMSILFFDASPTVASSDNAALDITDAELAAKYLGKCDIAATDYATLANASVACKECSIVLSGSGTTIYAIPMIGAAATFTSTSGIIFRYATV